MDDHGPGSGEHSHSPVEPAAGHGAGNSWVPILLALAVAALLIGIVAGVWLMVVGALGAVTAIVIWIRKARDEYRKLPD